MFNFEDQKEGQPFLSFLHDFLFPQSTGQLFSESRLPAIASGLYIEELALQELPELEFEVVYENIDYYLFRSRLRRFLMSAAHEGIPVYDAITVGVSLNL